MILQQILDFFANPDNWSGPDGIPARVGEHVLYTLVVVLIAAAIALPVGAVIGHTRRGSWLVINIANASRALPTLGLLTLMVLLLGLGFAPAAIVLVVLAVPSILTAAYAGVKGVDPAAVDAARGIGMPEWRILLTIELPIAAQVILGGIRSAVLQVIATATVAAYIALGGVGRFLLDGLALRDYGQMAAGAILVALLALAADGLFAIAGRCIGGWRRQTPPRTSEVRDGGEATETRVLRTAPADE
ncbi:ABC transporter permease [Leucobacter japonicus]|uniref:ABC transporter permease n=1 Tax=Leucobacter japonicus TaxID=1461259 RepID=UPI000949A31D|nr:ABC transporter permease [Leucobacter japonicus]